MSLLLDGTLGVPVTTVTGTLPEANGGTGTTVGYCGFKNRIINGGMVIDQRNAGAAQTLTNSVTAYTVDRWKALPIGNSVTGQRVSNGAGGYRYQFTGATSVSALYWSQCIESANIYDLASNTATLSVDLANSLLTTVTWTAYYATTTDNFGAVTQIATGTFTVSSAVTRFNAQITIPSAATTGIQITFNVGAQTSGTWTLGNVQLEKGSTATSFDYRPYGTELQLCQRYFERIQPSTSYQMLASGFATATTNGAFFLSYLVKRAAAVITFSAANTFVINYSTDVATTVTAISINAGRQGTQSANVHANITAVLTTNSGCILMGGPTAASCYIDVSAEL